MLSVFICLRLFLWRGNRNYFCAFLQDGFVAAEMALLPENHLLYTTLYLIQWIGILLADRLELRLTPDLFRFLRHPLIFRDSVRDTKLLGPVFLGALACWFWPVIYLPPAFGLGMGILGTLLAKDLDPKTELQISNPLFYWQWKGWIHPKEKTAVSFSEPYPFLRKTKSTQKRLDKPNILFIFLESFRAKNVGALGAKVAASPCFDALAKEGILFSQCLATGPQTFYAALASLFGVQPALNTFHLSSYRDIPLIGLPYLLKREGYKTGWLDGSYVSFNETRLFFDQHGMDEIIGAEEMKRSGLKMSWGVHDEVLFDRAVQWLKEQKQPTFATMFTATNHHPWEPPPNWHFEAPKDLPLPYQRYLNTFAYTDACLGQFVERLRKENLLENTLLFITGDHGQQMCEREENYATRINLYQPNLHVPLLIYGMDNPRIIQTPCNHLDLFSTVVDLLHLEGPHHGQGKSLLSGEAHPIFFSMPSATPRFGCQMGPLKWIAPQELYDLEKDPEERNPLPIDENIKSLTVNHFSATESLFENGRWTPPIFQTKQIFQSGPQDGDINPLPGIYAYDLSPSRHLTDQTLIKIAKHAGPSLRYLHLPNSPFITDKTLSAIAKHCPRLTDFYAHHCPQLTRPGIETLLAACKELRHLSIQDCHEITELDSTGIFDPLTHLYLGEEIEPHFLAQCPHLTHLKMRYKPLSQSHLTDLQFWEASSLTDMDLQELLKKNPHLHQLKIAHAPQLRILDFTSHPWLTELELKDCPHLQHLHLKEVQIKNLTLIDCPELEWGDFQPLCRLIAHRCPKIPKEYLESARLY